jgi:hypothetical protein
MSGSKIWGEIIFVELHMGGKEYMFGAVRNASSKKVAPKCCVQTSSEYKVRPLD